MSEASPNIDSLFSAFSGVNPGCAIGVVRNGSVILSTGYGMADLEHGIPFTPSSVCYLASVSKQFTALATLLLVDDGELALNECVKSIIPEIPDCAGDITIWHLLTHTSGLRDYFALGYLSGLHSEHPYSEDDVIQVVSRHESLNFMPGKEFIYSNTGYVLLSIVIKKVTGQTLDEFARERIFNPLGMKVSRFQHDHTALIANKAHGYERRAGAWHTSNSMLDVAGDGGMYSSVEDMLLWLKNFERPTVGEQALRLMQTEVILDNGQGTGYGMGLGPVRWRGLHTVGHAGGLAGYRAMFRAFPSEKTSIVVLCNSGEEDASKLVAQVADVFLSERIAAAPSLPPTSPTPLPTSGASTAIDPTCQAVVTPDKASESNVVGDYESSELRKTYSVAWSPDGITIVADGIRAQQLSRVSNDRMRFANVAIEIEFHFDQDQKPTGFALSSKNGRVKNLRFRRL